MTYDPAEQHAKSLEERKPSSDCIMSRGYDGMDWILVDKDTQELVEHGQKVHSRSGRWVIVDGTAPHKPSSTGRVVVQAADGNVRGVCEFFPSVVNAQWVPVIDWAREG